jgi:hypothetical protein
MNDAFGLPDDLPFDLKVRRFPIRYHLPQNAVPDTRKSEKRKLVSSFKDALGAAVDTGLLPLKSVYEKRGILIF